MLAAGAGAPKLKEGLLVRAGAELPLPALKLKAGAAVDVLAGAAPNGFDRGAGEAAGLATGWPKLKAGAGVLLVVAPPPNEKLGVDEAGAAAG